MTAHWRKCAKKEEKNKINLEENHFCCSKSIARVLFVFVLACVFVSKIQREQSVEQSRNRATTTEAAAAATVNNGWKLHVEKIREIVTRKCTNCCWSCNECERIKRQDSEQVSKRKIRIRKSVNELDSQEVWANEGKLWNKKKKERKNNN